MQVSNRRLIELLNSVTPADDSCPSAARPLELSQHAPSGFVVPAAALVEITRTLGLANMDALRSVTQQDCRRRCVDEVDAAILWAIVVALCIHLPPKASPCEPIELPPRKDRLPTLGVVALQGNFEDAPSPPSNDPLVLIFENVFPSTPDTPTKIFGTVELRGGEARTFEVPANLENARDGRYTLILGDDWLRELGRRGIDLVPGQIVDFVQKHGDREASAATIRINAQGPGVSSAPDIRGADRVGDPDVRGALFRRHDDNTLPAVRPRRFEVGFDGSRAFIRDPSGRGTEAKATITLENLVTGATADERLAVVAKEGEPILMQIFDGPGRTRDGIHERSLVFEAGRDTTPILVENPQLFAQGPQVLDVGRLSLEGNTLRGSAAATAGTVLTIYRADRPDQKIMAVASLDGSFEKALPFRPHDKDVLIVEGQNASGLGTAHYWHEQAKVRAELEVKPDGGLTLLRGEGAVQNGGRGVEPSDNVDHAERALPSRKVLMALSEACVSFSVDYPIRQYESVSVSGRTDRRHTNVAAGFDPSTKEVVFQVGMGMAPQLIGIEEWVGGGWPKKLGPQETIHGRADSFGNADYSVYSGSPTAKALRQFLGEQPHGSKIAARFESPDGEVFARGRLTVDITDGETERDTRNRIVSAKAGAADIVQVQS